MPNLPLKEPDFVLQNWHLLVFRTHWGFTPDFVTVPCRGTQAHRRAQHFISPVPGTVTHPV